MNRMLQLRIALLAAVLCVLAGCGARSSESKRSEVAARGDAEKGHADESAGHGDGHAGAAEGAHEEAGEGHVVLSPEAVVSAGIRTAVAAPGTIHLELDLPGEIVPNANRVAHIVPRFSGIAREIRKDLGAPVREGEVLAVVESNESLTRYEVRSLISGTVIQKHITLGEFVRDDADIYVVADLGTVWVNVSVPAGDLTRVRRGQRARIAVAGGSTQAAGTIDYVAPIVDESSRAATARIVLPNRNRQWRPGSFVSVRVAVDQLALPVVIAAAAIQRIAGEDVVFALEGKVFELRPVVVGRSDGERVEIVQGLAAGEAYVDRGGFILKSEILKSEAGHDH